MEEVIPSLGLMNFASILVLFPTISEIFLQVTALVLAIANRKVKIEVLNDFKEMSIIVYTISVMFIPLFAITYSVSSYTTISEILFSGAIMLATTVFLFFTFVPKVSCGSAYFFE